MFLVLVITCWPTAELKGVGVNAVTSFGLDLIEQILREFYIKVCDIAGLYAGEVAMRIASVAV